MKTLNERFWEKVLIIPEHSCWEWIGTKSNAGYGRFYYKNRKQVASRVAYEITCGIIPKGICVLHRCDNPGCVRPDHLFLGTLKDNSQDMIKKNRQVKVHGEKSGNCKLKSEDVLTIRVLSSKMTQKQLSTLYRVNSATISRIVNKKRWTHI